MSISCQRQGNSCSQSGHWRYTPLLPCKLSVHPVSYHLINQRKRHCKCKSCYKSTHQVIGLCHLGNRQLCKKDCKILAAIIIIDLPLGIPQIGSRQRSASHHSFHEAIIHKLFCSICLWMKTCKISPHKKCCKKDHFFPKDQISMAFRHTPDPLSALMQKKQDTAHNKNQYYCHTGKCGKCCKLNRHQKPGKKSGNRNCKGFGKNPAFIRKSLKKPPCQWHGTKSQHTGKKPPGPERPHISFQKICGASNQGNCQQKLQDSFLSHCFSFFCCICDFCFHHTAPFSLYSSVV